MGKGKGKAHQAGGKGKAAGGWQPRRQRDGRQQHRYGDAEWEQQFRQLGDQLRTLNLRIKSIAGDGNCLFRAVSDQLYGQPNSHAEVRAAVCKFIEEHRLDFEPFVEDDVPFDRYLRNMKQDKTWGGNIELQAMSQHFRINISIHQLNSPRWDIINFPGGKTIHLSYHDGDHYASVRTIGEPDTGVPSVQVETSKTHVVGEDDTPPPPVPAKKKSKKELRLENKAKKAQWNKEKRAAAATSASPSSSSSSSSHSSSASSSSSSSSSSSASVSSFSSSSSSAQSTHASSFTGASVAEYEMSSSESVMSSGSQAESFAPSASDEYASEAEQMVMAATNCSPQVARATLRDVSGDIFQAVEFLLLLAPHERENVVFGSASAPIPTEDEAKPPAEGVSTGTTEADLVNEYSDYSDYGGYPVEPDTSWESQDWRDYVKPQHQRQRGGGRHHESNEQAKLPTEQAKKGKYDEDSPVHRLRILREKRTLTNKERKEKNKLEKDVGGFLDQLEAEATEPPAADQQRPVVDMLGTLAI